MKKKINRDYFVSSKALNLRLNALNKSLKEREFWKGAHIKNEL
jgi:hypothetical protein